MLAECKKRTEQGHVLCDGRRIIPTAPGSILTGPGCNLGQWIGDNAWYHTDTLMLNARSSRTSDTRMYVFSILKLVCNQSCRGIIGANQASHSGGSLLVRTLGNPGKPRSVLGQVPRLSGVPFSCRDFYSEDFPAARQAAAVVGATYRQMFMFAIPVTRARVDGSESLRKQL